MITGAPSTIGDLSRALAARMVEVVEEVRLATKTTTRAPTVTEGWLPNPTPGSEPFPFVLVRVVGVTDDGEEARAKVKIIIGTLSSDDAGFRDVYNMAQATWNSLGTQPVLEIHGGAAPFETVATAIQHIGPLEIDIPDEQAMPQWHGYVTTTFRLPRPARVEVIP